MPGTLPEPAQRERPFGSLHGGAVVEGDSEGDERSRARPTSTRCSQALS
jgi:hypothetical protein